MQTPKRLILGFDVSTHLYGQEGHRRRRAVQAEHAQGVSLLRRRAARNMRQVVKSAPKNKKTKRTKTKQTKKKRAGGGRLDYSVHLED